MADLKARFSTMSWSYAGQDETAFRELCRRVAEVGRSQDIMTYTDLVTGVTFQLDNVEGGEPFEIDTHEWSDRDRAIVGSFLGRLCAETYHRGRFMGSALVVRRSTGRPTGGFWDLMRDIRTLESTSQTKRDEFWLLQVNLAHDWYRKHEW